MEFCSIASGSSGNCTYAGTEHSAVLVDVGMSGKRIREGLQDADRKPEDIDAILITHEHADHIKGLGVMARKYGIPIYATQGTISYITGCSQLGVIDPELLHVIRADEPFSIGDLSVEAFSIWHDAAEPVGYRLSSGGKSIAVATDMGCYDDYIVEHLRGLDSILLEANHDVNMLQVGPYPWPLKQRILGKKGHLSNDSAGSLLCDILHDKMSHILLGHLSQENNYAALAYATVRNVINMGECPYKADDFNIEVAKRDCAMAMMQA